MSDVIHITIPDRSETARLKELLALVYDAVTEQGLGWPNWVADDVREMLELSEWGSDLMRQIGEFPPREPDYDAAPGGYDEER